MIFQNFAVLSAVGGINVGQSRISNGITRASEFKYCLLFAFCSLQLFLCCYVVYCLNEFLCFCDTDIVVLVAVLILALLFSIQHHGIDKVGLLFAPIVLLWFLLIGGIGIFNIWKYDSGVLRAFSPVYIYRYFRRGKRDGWTSLGGIMLSITGKSSGNRCISVSQTLILLIESN